MEAHDVVAVVAVITSAIVGIAGVVTGTVVARADRVQAAQMAIHDRRQARLEGAYIELPIFAETVGAWAQALLPAVNGDPADPERDAPALPEPATEWSMRAKVAAFGSSEVQNALEGWGRSLRDVRREVVLVQRRRGTGDGNYLEPWIRLDETAKPAEVAARKRLQQCVAQELDELKDPARRT